MRLLHFAHRGEAQTFIKRLGLKPIDDKQNVYQKDKTLLCLSGEGPFEALNTISYLLGKYKIQEVFNIGIAGSLSPQVEKQQTYFIRTSYAHLGERIQFHSFSSLEKGQFDCITSFERVLDDEYAKTLSHFGDIVDRELWGVAKACSITKTPWVSLKYISDMAGNETNCFDLKAMAQEFSNNLYENYSRLEWYSSTEEKVNELKLPFHASFTQKKRIEKLTTLLKLPQHQLKNIAYNIKDANELIEQLEEKVNPINAVIKKEIKNHSKAFDSIGAQILINPKLDQRKIKLQMEINSQKNIDNLIECLKKFEFSKIEDLWDGKLDV